MRKIRFFLLALLAVAVVAAGIGLFMYFKPHKDFGASAPDVEISARDLVQAFADNEQRATRAYVTGDRTSQVSGTVRRMVTDERSHRTVVTLDAGDLGSVSCTLVSPGASSMKAVAAGAQMTVKGQCTGMQELFEKEVVMIRC